MVTQDLEDRLLAAFIVARKERHEIVTTEHMLLSILGDPFVTEILEGFAADTKKLERDLNTYIICNVPVKKGTGWMDTESTPGFTRVLMRASIYLQRLGVENAEINATHLLWAILGEKNSFAGQLLAKRYVTRKVVDIIIRSSFY
jgi:ATP-dependent Clp protease ATP-binding subunit ClpA